MKTFIYNHHQITENLNIPDSIICLYFGSKFNDNIKTGDIPIHIKYLIFHRLFDKPIDINVLPSSITHLKFSRNFNQYIFPGSIPQYVTHLWFDWKFDKPLDRNCLPNNIRHLIFNSIKYHPLLSMSNEILRDPNIETYFRSDAILHPKKCIYNIFKFGLNKKIDTNKYIDKYLIEDKRNIKLFDCRMTVIRLIPKYLLQSKTKSARKI